MQISIDLASIDLFVVFYVGYKSTTWLVRGFDLAYSSSKQAVPNTNPPSSYRGSAMNQFKWEPG